MKDDEKNVELEAEKDEAPKDELADDALEPITGGRKIDTSKLKPEDVWIPIN